MSQAISELPVGAKCTRCRGAAVISMPSHNAKFCGTCFLGFFQAAVRKALKSFGVKPLTPILIAVSGGKDSLSLWQVLHDLGYETKGIHINLGIDGFSDESSKSVAAFAHKRNLRWVEYSLEKVLGYTIPEVRRHTRRKICSLCGVVKRQMLNRLTIQEGFQILAVGHNLDDEAGRLLGNIVRHRYEYLEKQSPFLPSSHPRLPAKVKPLYRLDARDIRIYCKLKGIEFITPKCPLSLGATSHTFQDALDFLEHRMPGTKRDFLFTFLHRKRASGQPQPGDFRTCVRCGEPAYSDVCSVCRLVEQLDAKKAVASQSSTKT